MESRFAAYHPQKHCLESVALCVANISTRKETWRNTINTWNLKILDSCELGLLKLLNL